MVTRASPDPTELGFEDSETTDVGRHPAKPASSPCVGPFRLVIIAGVDVGKRFLVTGEAMIGRSTDCTIQLGDPTVSRTHARVFRDESGQALVENLSKNETFLNGLSIRAHRVSYGDTIRLGDQASLLVAPHDPAERQRLEADRMQAIGYLSAGIAHDFNNLLGAVVSTLDYLDGLPESTGLCDRDVTDCRSDMRIAATRSTELVARLLAFARQGADEHQECDVQQVCESILHLVRRSFDRKIDISVELEPGLWVAGDRSQLMQLLLNLCINARDAMPAGGVLKVRTKTTKRHEREYVVITVEDTGVGMDEETKERVFEKFFTTKSATGGSGLGLATVLEVAKWHGGFVELDSEPGRGATFGVYLPRMRRQARAPNRPTLEARFLPAPTTLRASILVVDDDEVMRRSTGRLLRQAGHEVIFASDGLEAVSVYSNATPRPDLVLLDLDMPGMDGNEALSQLIRIDGAARVVVVSGYATDQWEERVTRAGAAAFLHKPFDAKRLIGLISLVLTRHA